MASVTLDHVCKEFDGTKVVRDVSLEIHDKEFLVLVGPSGCGKSTILRMIAGLEDVSDGDIYIGDRLVNDVSAKDRDIAMVFQNYALYPHMSVFDNLAYGLKLRRLADEDIKPRVEAVAERLGIGNCCSANRSSCPAASVSVLLSVAPSYASLRSS